MATVWLSSYTEILIAAGLICLLIFFAKENRKRGFSKGEHLGWITEIWLDLMTWKAELLSDEKVTRSY